VRKAEIIAGDVIEQLRDGLLPPGTRVASFLELRATYSASQRVVEEALRNLADMGLVVCRPKSGTFVSDDALSRLEDPGLPSSDAVREDPPNVVGNQRSIDHFMRPPTARKALAIYVTEMQPSVLAVWRSALREVHGRGGFPEIELLTCADGHVGELLTQRPIDIVFATQSALPRELHDDFIDLSDPAVIGVKPAELLDVVQELLACKGRLSGFPFSVTLQYLFLNMDLARKAGVRPRTPASASELLRGAEREEPLLREHGARSLVLSGQAHDYLLMEGAVRRRDGQLQLDEERARRLLDCYPGARFLADNAEAVPARFMRGESLYLHHCSYEVPEIQRRARFEWEALPLPVSDGCRVPAHVMLLCVHKDTPWLAESLELVKHLCSPDVQRAFGVVHGNLPVRTDAVFHPSVLREHPVSEQTLRSQLALSDLTWPPDLWTAYVHRCSLDREEGALVMGDMDVDEALGRLRIYLERCGSWEEQT